MHKEKKKNKSTFRRVSEWLHLWLGLLSGIVVFIVCLTAAIWVFRDEMAYFANPEEQIGKEEKRFLPPTQLIGNLKNYLSHDTLGEPLVSNVIYRNKQQTTLVTFQTKDSTYLTAHLNPYSGKVLLIKDGENSKLSKFLLFVRAGHRWLWFPRNIGSVVVGTSCILFLVTIITGIIWWYPKKWNKSTRDKSFKIKWSAKWKRLNIDLHNVLGFYAFAFCFILITTGVTYSFRWFDNAAKWTLTGNVKEKKKEQKHIVPLAEFKSGLDSTDIFWEQAIKLSNRENEYVYLGFPGRRSDEMSISLMAKYGRMHNQLNYVWDGVNHSIVERRTPYQNLQWGEKMFSYKFELHIGSIYGLPTKILACLTSLIGASLPVTGFIIWWNRKRKGKTSKVFVSN